MTPIGDKGFDPRATAANAGWRARALQKPNAASDLHGKAQGEPHQPPPHDRKSQTVLPPQSGTQSHVPFRHAPRLTAAFTAQLLGQIMPDPERPSSGFKSAQSYDRPCLALSPYFDTSL
jgi:hypothetical protein